MGHIFSYDLTFVFVFQVLNEKSKELSDARIQIQHFTQSLQQERERVAQLEASQIEMR